MARNFIRYIDQIPFFYAVGVIAVFATRQHQRLGDLAAGTLVVRDREQETPLWADPLTDGSLSVGSQAAPSFGHLAEAHRAVALSADAVAKLAPSDLELLESFFARRLDLPLETRQAIAEKIAIALQAKSGLEPPPGVSIETFLEAIARDLRDLGRMR